VRYCVQLFSIQWILIILFSHTVYGVDWKFYGTTSGDDDAYYDRGSIERLSEGSVRVWELHILSDETRDMLVLRAHAKGLDIRTFDDAAYGMYLTEINCIKKEYRNHFLFLYNRYFHLLSGTSIQDTPRIIRDHSSDGALYRAVCPGKGG